MTLPRRAGRRTEKSPSRAAVRARRSSLRAWELGESPFAFALPLALPFALPAAGVALDTARVRMEAAFVANCVPSVVMPYARARSWEQQLSSVAQVRSPVSQGSDGLLQSPDFGNRQWPPA